MPINDTMNWENRASCLLAFQLRKAQASCTVAKILHPNSKKIISHPKDIANAFSTYYEALYDSPEATDKAIQIERFLENINLPSLNDTQSEALVKPISIKEIEGAIKNLKNNKSPGVDVKGVNVSKMKLSLYYKEP